MKQVMIVGGIVGALVVLVSGVAATVVVGAVLMLGNQYGTKMQVKCGELYYTENASEEEASALAKFLDETYGDSQNQITFQLDKTSDGTMIVRMCAQPKAWQTKQYDMSFIATEMLIQQQVFPDSNVVFELCDDSMKTQKTFDETPLKK